MSDWIAIAVGKMHVNKISHAELATKMGYTREYVTMLLNGKKEPDGIGKRILQAINDIIAERQSNNQD